MLPKGNLGKVHHKWDGWNLTKEGHLIDPAGNRYTPQDLEEAFYGRQLYKSLAGSQMLIRSLKKTLEQKIREIPKTTVQISYVTQGGEERKKYVELS